MENLQDLVVKLKNKLNEISSMKDLEEIRIEFLGKKGYLSSFFSLLKDASADEKIQLGSAINLAKQEIVTLIDESKKRLEIAEWNDKELHEVIDVTIPGYSFNKGSRHPVSLIIEEVKQLFFQLGFSIAEGPEVEEDYYNFELMNLSANHPARDMQDTFYFSPTRLLRTHTSPVQARTMEKSKGKPIKIICPGKAYRRDEDDATHSHQFSQIEGLVVSENVTMADLKGTLSLFAKHLFGEKKEIRFRSSYFPFTEPSVEIDISCICEKKGCHLCKGTGFIEILGAGMVHPNVLRMSGYDSDKYQGFAFGIGIERVAMLRYGITDIREFFLSNSRFLKLFNRE